jgi:hypothetical protein
LNETDDELLTVGSGGTEFDENAEGKLRRRNKGQKSQQVDDNRRKYLNNFVTLTNF